MQTVNTQDPFLGVDECYCDLSPTIASKGLFLYYSSDLSGELCGCSRSSTAKRSSSHLALYVSLKDHGRVLWIGKLHVSNNDGCTHTEADDIPLASAAGIELGDLAR
jgi:hypothetical protein